jgi:hypothetical protein
MSVTAGLITIGAALIPFLIWLYRKQDAKATDPDEENRKRKEAIARQIIRNDEEGANRSLDDDRRRIDDLRTRMRFSIPGDRSIPDSAASEGTGDVDRAG